MDVKIFKLVSGESIIGQIKYDDGNTITIENPVMIDLEKTKEGLGIGFLPWIPYAEEQLEVNFSSKSIMIILTPVIDILNQYNSIFNSNSDIVVPEKPGLIL